MKNLCLYDKEDVERVCQKSKKAMGYRWKWRKIADRFRLSLEEIEKQLDTKIERNTEYIERIKKLYEKPKAVVGSRDTDKQPLSPEITEGDATVTIDGVEVRPGQADDGVVTNGGAN
mgnify:CR=1 FL=1